MVAGGEGGEGGAGEQRGGWRWAESVSGPEPAGRALGGELCGAEADGEPQLRITRPVGRPPRSISQPG